MSEVEYSQRSFGQKPIQEAQDFNEEDPYSANEKLLNSLRQEKSPDESVNADSENEYEQNKGDAPENEDEFDINDKYLNELEEENLKLEQELQAFMQKRPLENKPKKDLQITNYEMHDDYDTLESPPHQSTLSGAVSPSDHPDQICNTLPKISERLEEYQESYLYSQSDGDPMSNKKKLTFSAGKNQQSASKGKVPLLQITSPKFDESEENHVVEQSPLENSARKELKTMLKAINKTENSYPNSANGSAKRDIPLPSNAPANHRKNQVSATSISQENQSILSKQSKETGLGTTGCNSRASIVTSQKEVLQQKNQSNTSDSFTRPKSRSASKKSAEKNNQESLSPTRGKENKENFSNSANNQQIPPNKIATLEFRLVGANKTIKSMEKELKMKDDKIQELLKEIEKKNRLFEMLQSKSLAANQSEKKNETLQALTSNIHKKEKELEKKVKDQEVIIVENKKYMTSLQELNAKLLRKVKELEEKCQLIDSKDKLFSRLKQLENENQTLKTDLAKANEKAKGPTENTRKIEAKQKKIADAFKEFESRQKNYLAKNNALNDTILSLMTKYLNTHE